MRISQRDGVGHLERESRNSNDRAERKGRCRELDGREGTVATAEDTSVGSANGLRTIIGRRGSRGSRDGAGVRGGRTSSVGNEAGRIQT